MPTGRRHHSAAAYDNKVPPPILSPIYQEPELFALWSVPQWEENYGPHTALHTPNPSSAVRAPPCRRVGKVYVFGGRDASNLVLNTVGELNVETGQWTAKAPMPEAWEYSEGRAPDRPFPSLPPRGRSILSLPPREP